MDISEIELIQCIHETGGISQACKILNISQPTLSKKLARIEKTLGARLFHRYSKGLIATKTAKYIISKSEYLRRQVDEIERHVELMAQFKYGQVNLGVGPIIEQILLPDVLKEFLKTTSGAKLSVVTEDDDKLLDMFTKSELDIIVGPFSASSDFWKEQNIKAIPMVKDEIVAVARIDHPVFEFEVIDEQAIAKFPLVSPKVQGTTISSHSVPVVHSQTIMSDSYDLMKKLATQTDAICAGPRAVFEYELAKNVLKEIMVSLDTNWESALLVRPETLITPLAGQVITLFENLVANQASVHPKQ